jgi:hypothetical protein
MQARDDSHVAGQRAQAGKAGGVTNLGHNASGGLRPNRLRPSFRCSRSRAHTNTQFLDWLQFAALLLDETKREYQGRRFDLEVSGA